MPRFSSQRTALATLVAAVACACGAQDDTELRIVRVAPEAAPSCGAPEDARTLILRALGEFSASEATAQSIEIRPGAPFSVERFPESTRVLEAEVRGFGGALRTVGRSAVFAAEALQDGGEIAVFMAPLDGICETGPAAEARVGGKLAHVRSGVLVVGGTNLEGEPAVAAELYRHEEGRFDALTTNTYGDTSSLGLAGASVTSLPSGDAVLVGGAATAFQVFDGESEEFLAPAFYREARGHHAALALDAQQILLAGGCSQVTAGGCAPDSELLTSSLLDIETGEITPGPSLAIPRMGGSAWLEAPGQVLLVGGFDLAGAPVEDAERVFLDGRESERVPGMRGASAQVASGAVWAGFAEGGAEASGVVSSLGPRSASSALAAEAGPDSDVHLVALEDGSLLAIGASALQRIRSIDGVARSLELPMGAAVGRAALRLLDGSVLLVGGRTEAGEPAASHVYRPSLVGPYSASMTASFLSEERSEGLTASHLDRVVIDEDAGSLRILSGDDEAWVLVAGPRPQSATLEVALAAEGSADARLYFGWQSLAAHLAVRLVPGEVASLVQTSLGESEAVLCEGEPLSESALSGDAHEVALSAQAANISVTLDGTSVLRCTLPSAPAPGFMGVGTSEGAALRVDLISLSR